MTWKNWTLEEHLGDPKEIITLDRRWGKEGVFTNLGEKSGIPVAGIENLDSGTTNNKYKGHSNIL